MCGITGKFHYNRAASMHSPSEMVAVAQKMTDSLRHRGPDGGGIYCDSGIVLGHRRLSILDISERGLQPMTDSGRQFWIVFNGEIYNFQELRKRLAGLGATFHSHTDTEVILQAYKQWGKECVHEFNGMFAFAIWDGARRQIWLARDPIGIKPLYYRDDGNSFWFGSEIKAILADASVPRTPDLSAIDSFLSLGYTPAPVTGFAGIRQLLPGHSILVREGSVENQRYYSLPYPKKRPEWDLGTASRELQTVLTESVNRQLVSDVPVGAFLSGGIDSSAIVNEMCKNAQNPPRTFCVGFEESSFDETPYARKVATHLGAEFNHAILSADIDSLLTTIVSHSDDLIADTSLLPTFLLSKMTRGFVKVALSGDGCDELLAGYDTYRASRFAPHYRRLPKSFREHVVVPLANCLPASTRKYGLSMVARRFVKGAERGPWRDHCSWREFLPKSDKWQLYTEDMRAATNGNDPIDTYVKTITDAPSWATPLDKHLHMDTSFHLPNDMLVKVDRMSMAHGLEVRVPLLDLEFVRTCVSIPSSLKLRGRTTKYILKHLLKGALPNGILNRKKAGFVLPVESWLRGRLQPFLCDALDPDFLQRMGLVRPERAAMMVSEHATGKRDHAYGLFALLILALWWRIWIERSASENQIVPRDCAPTIVLHQNQK